jgi:hypothetical protein
MAITGRHEDRREATLNENDTIEIKIADIVVYSRTIGAARTATISFSLTEVGVPP